MSRVRIAIAFLILFAAPAVIAAGLNPPNVYYPNDFYDRVETGLRDADLKTALHQILSQFHQNSGPQQHDELVGSCARGASCYRHISLGYNGARRLLFGPLHMFASGSGYRVRDVYCEEVVPVVPDRIPDHQILNAEHTWPQSRFSSRFPKDLQKSDLHILFPVLSHANSARGNIRFSDVITQVSSPCSKSKRGFNANGRSETFFEVPDAHKGNVARAIFYFSTRYLLPITPQEEVSLRAWHHGDPVDEAERQRHVQIFAKQKVRNPFIDYPELASLIADF